jgi:NADPH:quinone reductase-like Zn-dependent oxidoreductase
MMKAMVCTKYGSPDVLQLQEVEKPVPTSNEVLIKVHAATATTASVIGRTGKPHFVRLFFGLTRPRKAILGQELAGEIEAIGSDVKSFKVGDKVFGMTGTELGAHAQFGHLGTGRAKVLIIMLLHPRNGCFQGLYPRFQPRKRPYRKWRALSTDTLHRFL